MKNLIEKNKEIVAFVISAIFVAMMKINFMLDGTFIQKLAGNSLDTIVYTIILTIAILKVFEIKDKRMSIISLIVAFILAVLQILGLYIANGCNIFPKSLLIKFIGYLGVFFVVIKLIYYWISRRNSLIIEGDVQKSSNKRFYILMDYYIYLLYSIFSKIFSRNYDNGFYLSSLSGSRQNEFNK